MYWIEIIVNILYSKIHVFSWRIWWYLKDKSKSNLRSVAYIVTEVLYTHGVETVRTRNYVKGDVKKRLASDYDFRHVS